jgi:hypothetical protein
MGSEIYQRIAGSQDEHTERLQVYTIDLGGVEVDAVLTKVTEALRLATSADVLAAYLADLNPVSISLSLPHTRRLLGARTTDQNWQVGPTATMETEFSSPFR